VVTAAAHREALRALPRAERTSYLDRHSGLPGPRADLGLLQAAADTGDGEWFEELAASPDEFRAAAGAVGLGRRLADRPDDRALRLLHALAADPRWRVREGVAMGLQRLGDTDPPRLWSLARRWAADPDPLVQRAAAAGICEPRLLRTPEAAAVAVQVCESITATLAARPAGERRTAGTRSLRQALGYCWSVAVAADPVAGLPRFEALTDDPDPDIAWIVRENKKKARLIRLQAARSVTGQPADPSASSSPSVR
jgi:HEAT repeats